MRQAAADAVRDTPEPVVIHPELGYSSKLLIGWAITRWKRIGERRIHHVLEDAFAQVSERLIRLEVMLDEQERRITSLEDRIGK